VVSFDIIWNLFCKLLISNRESNAILQYIVDKYDKERKISTADGDDKFVELQWLYFQASGQGPYFGQAGWFSYYHPEKVPSAVERYKKEIIRVLGVLESVLSKQEWLVGGKLTIADISFIPYVQVYIDDKKRDLW
jgi:glutathione S-transferase